LMTASGATAYAEGSTVPADHDGWMWDLSVPGGNDHDFYVLAAADAALVHNCPNPFHGTSMSDEESLNYHYARHGNGVSMDQYIRTPRHLRIIQVVRRRRKCS
jgi:hypothetical protein